MAVAEITQMTQKAVYLYQTATACLLKIHRQWKTRRWSSLGPAAPSGRRSNLQLNIASSAVTFITSHTNAWSFFAYAHEYQVMSS